MGVVARQGFKFSVVNIAGLLLGVASTMLIYSKKEVADLYGLVRFLLDSGLFWYPILSLGVTNVTIRFFARFEDRASGHHGYLSLLLVWVAAGFLLFAAVWGLSWPFIRSFFASRDIILRNNLWAIIPIAGLQTINSVLAQYSAGFKRIVVPSILVDFLPKLAVPLLVLLYLFAKITSDGVVVGMMVYLSAITVGMLVYIKSLGQLHLRFDRAFLTPKLAKEMIGFSAYGISIGLLMMVVTKLDTIIVPAFLGAGKNTVYAIAAFFASVLDVPIKAIVTISVPLLAKYWHEQNFDEIDSLYKKSSINLLIVGIGMLGTIWLSLADVFALLQNREAMAAAYWVVFWLGAAKLVDMVTGLNNYILVYSKHHYYYLYTLSFLGALNIALNSLLIPRFGLTGVAVSVFCSAMGYNLINLYLVWKKYGFLPFSDKVPVVVLVGLASFAVVWLLPTGLLHPIVSIGTKSVLFVAMYASGILYFKASSDFDDFVRSRFPRLG